jgi:DNA-binding response OmpR family regulator
VDRARHRASRGGRSLSLTGKESGILETLLAADGVLVSAEELLEHVWDAEVDPFSNIVSVTMTRLRRKASNSKSLSSRYRCSWKYRRTRSSQNGSRSPEGW